MLMLSAVRHLARITLLIASTPPRSSTEHMFRYSLYSDKMKTATAKVGGITQNIEGECARCVLLELL